MVAVNLPINSPLLAVFVTDTSIKLIAAFIFGVAGFATLVYGWVGGWLGVLICVGILSLHARQGGAAAAFTAFKKGDLAAVRRAVRNTWWPGLLSKQNQAYQNWMEGVVLAADCRFMQARQKLLVASSGAIQTENDRSLIQCLLAEVSMQLNDWRSARDHYDLAKRLNHHKQVDEMIAAGEERLQAQSVDGEASVNREA